MSLLETHQAENIVITGELRIINPSIISDDKQEHQEHLARQSTKHSKRQAIWYLVLPIQEHERDFGNLT